MSKADRIPRTRTIVAGPIQQDLRKTRAFVGKENARLAGVGRKDLRRKELQKKIAKSNGPRCVLGDTDTEAGTAHGSATPNTLTPNGNGEKPIDIKARNAKIEDSLRSLEKMAQVFKERVEGIVGEFEGLRDDVDALNFQYGALELDYQHAIKSVEEERKTAAWYSGLLDNARVEIEHLQHAVPEADHPTAFSQAKWWK
ncbi:hypothetical protein FA13DRAFT_1805453 [Coprinellus micaceus]|uniref:Uncharacterized protein n=1 Tax=Coprinellus micaceus TaxID=71717 RepID=A0A4Y7S1Q3_COPMI|nr:hypothetical protein FA13DRAFT_1805453 [Coprinellus micaceus]